MSSSEKLSTKEAADYLGVSVNTIRNYISKEGLKWERVGPKLIKITTAELDAFIARSSGGTR